MGSLMAGWDSPNVQDLKAAEKLRRNSSLTREEIEGFWRSKKKSEEDHLQAISALSHSPRTHNILNENELEEINPIKYRRSSSVPAAGPRDIEMKAKIIQKNGWWVSSKWAFLNEAPVM